VSQRGEHEDDVVAAEAERLRHRPQADIHRFVAVDHTLGLARRPRGEHELRRVSGRRAAGVELGGRMLVLPGGLAEVGLEPGAADEDVLQRG
jgi:hypothetical protein